MGSYKTSTTLLYQVVSPILIILGTVGNVLTIVVLSKRKSINASTKIFLMSLALADLLVLNNGLLRFWVKYTFDVEVRHLSKGACCLQRFSIFLTTQFSSWILVCVTMERLVSTWVPHRRSTICSTRIAIATVCSIGGLLTCLNAHYLFGFGDIHATEGNTTTTIKCVPLTERYEQFVYHEWTIIDMCVFYLIPMTILVLGNVAIVYKVIQSRKRSRCAIAPAAWKIDGSNGQGATQANKTSSLTITLVIISVTFVFCVAPIVIFPIGQPYWETGASQRRKDMLTLVETVAVLVMYVNHAINFALYFLSGTKFRRDVKSLLCHRCTSNIHELNGNTSGV